MQPLTTDGTSDADDETIDVNAEFESGFDPDAYGGAAEGVGESAVLLDDADGSRIQRQRPGLRSMRLVAESREKTCVYLIFMAAGWVLLLVVAALHAALGPAFPRTPPNADDPAVPVIRYTPAQWLGQPAEYSKGGDVIEHVSTAASNSTYPRLCRGAQVLTAGCLGSVVGYDGAQEEAEALSATIEGHLRPGEWKFFKVGARVRACLCV